MPWRCLACEMKEKKEETEDGGPRKCFELTKPDSLGRSIVDCSSAWKGQKDDVEVVINFFLMYIWSDL